MTGVRPQLGDADVRFVNGRTFAVAATLDGGRRPWAAPLFGREGRLFTVVDRTTVRLRPTVTDGDPLVDNVSGSGRLGVLYVDPSRRRRAKSLGRGSLDGESVVDEMRRNFGLCNRYLFGRTPPAERPWRGAGGGRW
ncbi:MAG: hypothetical protein AAGA93_27990 [Actinomycetota bacterium]